MTATRHRTPRAPRPQDAGTPFTRLLVAFDHAELATLPAYGRFREALADLADESTAPLHEFLTAVRFAALTSPLGATCTRGDTHGTTWPIAGQMDRPHRYRNRYICPTCGSSWWSSNDRGSVTWPNDEPQISAADSRG